VSGRRVTITLQDLSDRRAFSKSFYPSAVATTSADWIVEAPSVCNASRQCFALPLADFGRVAFSGAHATNAHGRGGRIASRLWNATKISLIPHGSRFFADTADASAEAVPSALTAGASAFTISYQGSSQPVTGSGPPGPFFARRDLHPAILLNGQNVDAMSNG
jgi:hypothetical protein